MKLIDLTHTITHQMPVLPGDSNVILIKTNSIEEDGYSNYSLNTGMHTGTHIDGPFHMKNPKKIISDIDISTFIGDGIVIDCRKKSPLKEIDKSSLKNSIALLLTGHDKNFHSPGYFTSYPIIDTYLIDYLIDNQVKIIGIDTPSPDYAPYIEHKKIFDAEIFLIENLTNIEKINPRLKFEIMAIPLKIEADSSPVRVIARMH